MLQLTTTLGDNRHENYRGSYWPLATYPVLDGERKRKKQEIEGEPTARCTQNAQTLGYH